MSTEGNKHPDKRSSYYIQVKGIDPDRNIKKLQKLFVVSRTIQKQTTRRFSATDKDEEELERKRAHHLKELRQQRISSLGANHRYILEIGAELLGIDMEEIVMGVVDEPEFVDLLSAMLEKSGPRVCMICYAAQLGYPPDSGRYVENMKRQTVNRAIAHRSDNVEVFGNLVAVYRNNNNKVIDNRTISEEVSFFCWKTDQRNKCIFVLKNFFDDILLKSLDDISDFNVVEYNQTQKFFHTLRLYIKFLKYSDVTVSSRVNFEVSHELFKGFLLAKFQIETSSKDVRRVQVVEKYFNRWMRQIQGVLVESQQIQKDPPDVGPLQMLIFWRHLLARLTSIKEFVSSQAFQNHKTCLTLSRSTKLLKKWIEIDNKMTLVFNEAKDNVTYLRSLQKCWDPLYRSGPDEIINCLPSLLIAIRNVSKSAQYFNTTSNVTGLFVKISNQLTIASKNFVTNNGKLNLWKMKPNDVIEKIQKCLEMLRIYKEQYFQTCEDMAGCGEKQWVVSSTYIFTSIMKFSDRLDKINQIFKTEALYSVLDRIRISGMEKFSGIIKTARDGISAKLYDPLNYRIVAFDTDFDTFTRDVERAEVGMQQFVKHHIADVPIVESVLLILARYERLHLECLCLDRRYLQVCEMLENEMFNLKDVYNEERDRPSIPHKVPPVAGRIMWIRSIFQKIDVPMQSLKLRACVLSHKKAQKVVRYYNYMNSIICHYEMTYHKAWFDYAEEVRCLLNSPILNCENESAEYTVNLDPAIRQLIKETEWMWKLKLEVPNIAAVVAHCKDCILEPAESLKSVIENFNKLRLKISPVFIRIMRFRLQEVSVLLKPGLSAVTWLSENLEDFIASVEKKVDEVARFYKTVSNIEAIRILNELTSLDEYLYMYTPTSPESSEKFYENCNTLRLKIEKEIEKKSACMELAVIDLCNMFVDLLEFGPTNSMGRRVFQLPPEEINESNWRAEGAMPVNKWDWIKFDQINRAIYLVSDDILRTLQFKNYENISYELHHLQNDCMDLFSYYNSKMILALVACSKRSLDYVRRKILRMNMRSDTQPPILYSKLDIDLESGCRIVPNLEVMQADFHRAVLNCTEINYFVNTWGKRAKTYERRLRRVTVDENRYERNYFRYVIEHKDIARAVSNLGNGLMIFKSSIDEFLKRFFDDYKYLWAAEREDIIQAFVNTNPLTVDIRDKFAYYDEITSNLENANTRYLIGPIEIRMENAFEKLIEESKKWKTCLGQLLSAQYKKQLDNMVEFISEQEKVLAKPINNLDDVRQAMLCLERIRDHFIGMDMELGVITDAYGLFAQFNILVSKEDYDKVDNLQLSFNRMLENAKHVSKRISDMEGPLLEELTHGIDTFVEEFAQFNDDYEANGPMVDGITAKEASNRVFIFQNRFDELWLKYEMYNSGEKLFGLPVSEYPLLHQRKREFNYLNRLYSLFIEVLKSIADYYEMPWAEVDIEKISNELADFQVRCRKLPKGMQTWPAYIVLKTKIDDFNETCPLLELMTNKAMKERHWVRLNALLNTDFDPTSFSFTLGDLLEAPILKNKEDVEDICVGAGKELDIEAKLKQVIIDWSVVNIQLGMFKNRGELVLKGGETLEIIASLEDSIMVMNSLSSNRYNAPFKKDIQLWLRKLVSTGEILEKWLMVQNLWIYLEAVFVGGDIAKQLPLEAKRFTNIDKSYVKIMYRVREVPNAVECCTADESLANSLTWLLDQLETCQKSLTGYLESKRLLFPRFFFVSDPVLLEILGQASNPISIQPHLLSIFDAVAYVDFLEKTTDVITALNSSNHEKIMLENSVQCTGSVELWLNGLLKEMQDTMRTVLAGMAVSLNDPEFNFAETFPSFCGQASIIGVQLLWTRDAEYALRKCRSDKSIMKRTNTKFLNLLNHFIDLTVKDLSPLDRIRFETMVTIHVHQRDIFDDLCRMRIRSAGDFEWQKQARFYYIEDNDDIIVGITDVDFIYQNEYLGVTERLAITPLTDRCYITLAQAIGMSMGGAPAGPAGTGKTETTKDMGRALGKLVVVFNCSDQMDFRGLGRIYKGLAQSGSWGCFDEFNRIELPVLSVAAQQIYIVLTARKEKRTSFIFSDGDLVTLNREFGLFITMNPGYAGRQELPENLKIMFRTVAMMVPDRAIIIRVKLASCGFKDNLVLSRKFFTLYKLCEEQLSKQVHYDFGLRNILSVLRTLGAQKRANPTDTEETIVMRVLRDMNVSKLIDEDEGLFISLIEDMFPGIKLTTAVHKELQRALARVTDDLGYVNNPEWNLKVVQLYETSLVRHGLMLMGPTGSGKTSCTVAMLRCFTEMGHPHKEMRMNPKAITAPQMFGRLDVATNDWTDGIFSTLWRRSLKVPKHQNTWIVLDGPVDAVWIENLNSVLDDNKTLTLANGDRIKMAENSKLVFEPDNVDNASPATVSRVGMTFMSSSVLQWNIYMEAWVRRQPPFAQDVFRRCFNAIYDDAHLFLQTKLIAKMKILEAIYVKQLLEILDGLLEDCSNRSEKYLERIFLFAMMWSLGAVLEINEREKLEEFFTTHHSKMKWPKKEPGETVFEYYVDDSGNWQHWNNRVEQYVYPEDAIPEFSSILVPNVDNVRTAFLMHNISKQRKQVLLIGEQGTAKTVMIKGYMANYDPEFHLSKSFNFSSATTPNMYQRIIESYVEKRVGTTYGPPGQRSMTIFIDDINMPIINAWGDQVTNEIVRQMIEQRGFYSLDKPGDFSTILDIQLLAAMIHPGGGRNDIPHRLKRHMAIFNCTLPSNNSMDQIFSQIGRGYFCLARFTEEVVQLIPHLVPLTRIFWQNVKVKMLPTPSNFHYVFNLRDLSRIWEGMLKVAPEECKTQSDVLKLWRHECTRVIADRFTDYKDTAWFIDRMKRDAKAYLSEAYMEQFPEDETFFVDFLRDAPDAQEDDEDVSLEPPKIYEEISSMEQVKDRVTWYMSQFNEYVRGFHMDMVFFHDALVHLIIVSRILSMPRGHALLVGVGGSGKQSLTRLASFIAGYKFFQITLTRAYNAGNLVDDLKYLYRTAGLEGQGITFIFTDNEIKDESFLEYINNILSSGEIANLFAKDEMDEIYNEIIPIMKKKQPRRPPTQDNLYDFFLSSARSNLHIALCFSPIGEKFRARSLKFPGLISGCVIDWFHKWPEDARVAVSRHYLENFEIACSPMVKENVINIMSWIHETVSEICITYFERFRRTTFVTPKSLISFLESYKKLYKDKKENIIVLADRMTSGLDKLDEAGASVSVLKKELVEMNKVIVQATEEAEVVLQTVSESTAAAEIIKAQVAEKKAQAAELVKLISADKEVAEAKLEKARPALEEAEAALKTIKAADIATVRKLGKPPYLITLIMDCVCILFRKRIKLINPDVEKQFLESSWEESLKVMSDTSFLKKIVEYPTDIINAEMVDLMLPYFNYSLYTLEAAKVACGNVAGLLSWTIAMAKYFEVNKEVLPLKANLAVQAAKYAKASNDLQEAEELFASKERELAKVQKQFDEAIGKKNAVLEEATRCQDKMDAATALINGLAGEKIRWTEQIAQFKSETERLVGDTILLTAFLSYTGPFNQEFRNDLQSQWLKRIVDLLIPISSNLNIIDSLTDRTQIGEWNLQGLPTDELSIQNGIIATKAVRFPLLIDPQSQGKSWIKSKEKENSLIVTNLSHRYFRTHIEDAVSLGLPVIIEDVGEELDPCLDNVLDRNLLKVGTTYKIKLGDKEIDYNAAFRCYITTKLPNPAYTPEVSARTSIIDFTVTMKGLEDQLLGRVILTERKELEKERTNLVETVTGNMKKMKELEANLLHKLSTTQGSLLDDVTVIEVLNTSKNTAIDVKEKLDIAKITEAKINVAREEYRPVATRGSVLYFLVCSMANVNMMYQTSLVQFLDRFDASMHLSAKTQITQKRIKIIIDYLTFEIYRYKSRGLYEKDKFLFVLLMALNIDRQMDLISYEEFQNFIKGGAALNLNDCPPVPHKWITDETWLNLVQLANLPVFSQILNKVSNNERGWFNWYKKECPESDVIPDGYNSLDPFRRLLLIRSWCTDRTLSQSRQYIGHSLGERFAEPVVLNFDNLLVESKPLMPIVCFLSMGSDPSSNIEALAKKNELKCYPISMGQGQEIHARKLVTMCMEDGGWVLLQNCHLGLEYMNELTLLLLDLERGDETAYSSNFRVWITTEPHPEFSITLLQMSLKFTNEPPAGVRAGLKRTYGNLSQDFLDYSQSVYYHPLVYAISFLHSVVQERRKFGPLGWNIPYEFNSADWYASCLFVQNHLDGLEPGKGISWNTVRYMLGEVQYGGRVTDDYDKRLLNTFGRVWFHDQLFAEAFEFFKGYKILSFKEQQAYLMAIEELPNIDSPQVYGFHPNAEITYQTNTTRSILDTIMSIQPKESSGGDGETREDKVAHQVREMQSKAPSPYDLFEVKERLKAMGALSSMNIFLRQEIDRMQKIIILVRSTLKDLLLAIEGTIIMSEQLRDALDNIFNARVPAIWQKGSWASSTLGFWFTEMLERNAQFHCWCFVNRPAVFWMSGFFNPQGFLTAMKQEVARAHHGWALDQVSMTNEVLKIGIEDCKKPPKEGVFVHGLYLDGAGWDRKTSRLIESTNKVLYVLMPVVHISAINSTAPKSPKLYTCPVYKKMNRTDLNYISPLWLNTLKNPDHWILRGVALLCDIK
ncbi:dynein axonemal heavy chain 8 [Stomoxys calcitrans]|uniref:dynein axonemal heavy chain 8 n=1 Tax=Stomoxys calcitrans TaxID=35570 RepID=UPI0027E38972|nr:dynein axonemal heavy chain 8 [Stomoxys calcitrans]